MFDVRQIQPERSTTTQPVLAQTLSTEKHKMLAPRIAPPPVEWLDLFLRSSHRRQYPAKTTIIHHGDVPETLYYIVDGSVSVVIEDDDGREIVLAYLSAGDFFGEMGLFDESAGRSAWVVEQRCGHRSLARLRPSARTRRQDIGKTDRARFSSDLWARADGEGARPHDRLCVPDAKVSCRREARARRVFDEDHAFPG